MDYPSYPCLSQGVSILVVDDDDDNLLLIQEQLRQLLPFCSVTSAQDGFTALSLAKSSQPDLILLDIMLPELDGFEVARRLREDGQTCRIPVVAVTAMARLQDEEDALQAGCDGYLRKPYELENLADVIEQYLGRLCTL